MERWKQVQAALDEFRSYLSPTVPPLKIEHLNDRRWNNDQYKSQLKTRRYEKPGVYLLFGADEKLIYVGMTNGTFHDRIWSHDDLIDRCFTDVIAFAPAIAFLIPSLEIFLIKRLHPPANKQHAVVVIPASEYPS